MNDEDKHIDELIKETLTKEEAKYYDQLHEQDFFQEFGNLFTGKKAWATILSFIYIFAFIGVLIWAIINFIQVESVKEIATWGLVILVSFNAIGLLKIWGWMQMDKNELKREIKRLELQVSVLAGKGQ